MSNSVIVISDEKFETEVLQAEQPVLAYFWAPWCGPCKLVSPSIDWIAAHYSDRLKVVKMEIDPNPATVKQYKVEGVPAIMLFKNSELVMSYEGAITKQKLTVLLEANL
ncbi:MAG: thioredoxin domain-containing protein [Tychonema bourrellyi B0820]|uniref:Thioredoxin n=1 Tax=Tychonema bourrellyi FEM_GT703 TaxID=2040638 RepID=A0A2G4EUX4_9CYAN|nr:thioredoxin domain-containing protein [Tychonema bourrellyi]MDQ2099434.1 thioredoxin domain-containing protein [Tychonema bourrellyi B0820]PHX53288.1 thioredoxin [Tychonema bourrellyi FEM_GT703]